MSEEFPLLPSEELTAQRLKLLCQEWAEDHTYLQKLCMAQGYSKEEVEGDEWGIKSIQDLADMLVNKLNGWVPIPENKTEPICHKCGKVVEETEGYLEKIKLSQPPPVWECRPECNLNTFIRSHDGANVAIRIGSPLRENVAYGANSLGAVSYGGGPWVYSPMHSTNNE